jgi:hypothetical protein
MDENIYYGFLVMVVCDENGMVYDIWFYPASYDKVKSLRIRYKIPRVRNSEKLEKSSDKEPLVGRGL